MTTITNSAIVYTDSTEVADLLANVHRSNSFASVEGFTITDNPNIAQFFITDTIPELNTSPLEIERMFQRSRGMTSDHGEWVFNDQQARLLFLQMESIPVSDKVAVVPFHQFIDTPVFARFRQMFTTEYFDLIELDGIFETVVATDTLDKLVVDYPKFLAHSELPNVFFSSEKKYMVKLARDDVRTISGIAGCTGKDENIFTVAFTAPIEASQRENLMAAVRAAMNSHSGFFTIEYYVDVKKVKVYNIKLSISPSHIDKNFLDIPEVQRILNNLTRRAVLG